MKFLGTLDKNISFKKLFLYWVGYLCIGIFIMLVVTPLSPSFSETSDKINENFCQPINLILVSLAFLTETLLFMILPWKLGGKKWLIVGLSIWALLHLLGGSLPIFLYISVMAVFYYRLLEIGKWKETMGFHFLINLPAILTCL